MKCLRRAGEVRFVGRIRIRNVKGDVETEWGSEATGLEYPKKVWSHG